MAAEVSKLVQLWFRFNGLRNEHLLLGSLFWMEVLNVCDWASVTKYSGDVVINC